MTQLFPTTLAIEPGLSSDLAQRVVDRVKAGNPDVDIQKYESGEPGFLALPDKTPKDALENLRWKKAKASLILRDKMAQPSAGGLRFLHVFVSVGDVIEEYSFTMSIENECPYRCQFCYIQGSLAEKPTPTIFANVQKPGLLLREVKIALLAMHMHTQSHGVRFNIGWDQKEWVHWLMGVLNKALPKNVADIPIQQIFDENKDKIKAQLLLSKKDRLNVILNDLDKYDFTDLKHKFKFNCGEINDALVYDHLTDNSKFLIELFSSDTMVKDGAVLLFRTKSANFNNLKSVSPAENIRVSVTVLPKTFVDGPPDYQTRLSEVNKLLNLGYQVSLNMDPMILTKGGTVSTYKKVIDEIKARVDTKSPKLHRITIGMLRFGSKNLDNNIRNRHPGLHGHAQRTMTKAKGDEKYRYDRAERIRVYKTLVDYIRTELPGVEVELSTEPEDVWKDVGLESNKCERPNGVLPFD